MSSKLAFKFTIAVVCSALTILSIGAQQTKENLKTVFTPEDIIDKMTKTYAACKSYQDKGSVKTVFIRDKGERIIERPFTTAFIRPDQFRFEYKKKVDSYIKEKPCYIVWRKGSEVLNLVLCTTEYYRKE